ncbi:MAG TPA: DUF3800 domain-containing protein [Anaerolineae bacterium]|nr:DUF3800 domain-containing protein [Anaerolineae bacterium]
MSEWPNMFFLYLDESGSSGIDPVQRFFVLAALAARVEHCMAIQDLTTNLKLKYFATIQPEEIEIKGRNLLHGKGFFANVRQETRQAILHEIYGLLKKQPLWLFATVVDKENPAIRRLGLSPDDVYRFAYKNLARRVDRFLAAEASLGLIFIDSLASSIRSHLRDVRLASIHREYLKEASRSEPPSRLLEFPVFVQGPFFAAIQLADVCAYAIFHAFQKHPDATSLHDLNPDRDEGLEVVLRMLDRSAGLERLP